MIGRAMPNYNSLSQEIQDRMIEDKANGRQNPFAFCDEKVIRREMDHDIANLWRPAFVRDIEKIIHCPYYGRYMDKTQVFSFVKNDDVSRRALHVQYVSRVARNIGKALKLNLDLIEAQALGHDIGHTPFGHAGEKKLSELLYADTGRYFNHNIHSARVLDRIFPCNLSLQTLDGIICHNGELESQEYSPKPYDSFEIFDQKMEDCYTDKANIKKLVPATLEGCVVRVSDIIAYLGKDRQDAMKLGLIDSASVFEGGAIGRSNAEIINNMIVNIIENSYGKSYIQMDEEYFTAFSHAKSENYEKIYNDKSMEKVYNEKVYPMFEKMYTELLKQAKEMNTESIFYRHHMKYIIEQTKPYRRLNDYRDERPEDLVVDFMASMTDDYFVDLYSYLFPDSNMKIDYKGYFD